MPDTETKTEETTVVEKTFTQEQVNGMIKKESSKAVEKLLKDLGVDSFENAKEGIAKLKEIEDSKKTDMDKLQDQVNELLENQRASKEDMSNKDIKIALLGANVPQDKLETYTKLLNVTDGETMESKMETVLKDFPLVAETVVDKPVSLGGEVGNGSTEKTIEQTSAEMDKIFGIDN